ncbi:ParB N-terminal domain-containing protein [Crossiella sp. SN42]|uniref:ParB/RepB/Spo0J family partition protein n=1 Tax=Crossiella sp. SN42 TaxID=2944808 RepID=UPI00207C983A|nr:ParB N-terminal domain-containing protein [Crossiella sp. SN42]MCO1580493.1 ParB N-terminal domain-containing protein [Crossiella sp. SN42]
MTGPADADHTSVLGDLADGAEDRTAVPIPVAAITSTIQVCGVDAAEEVVAGLAGNISEFGLLHPVEVMPNGDGTWTLVKGNGRLLAHRRLGLSTIQAFVDHRSLTEDTLAEIIQAQASENAHRKNLSILETLNTIDRLATPPCNRGRNAVGRIMHLPETTLKRYWRIYREIRDRRPHWHPAVADWLNTTEATWAQAAVFAADPSSQHVFAVTGTLPSSAAAGDAHSSPAPPRWSDSPTAYALTAPDRLPPNTIPVQANGQSEREVRGGPTGPPSPPPTEEEFNRLCAELGRVLLALEQLPAPLPPSCRSRLHALLVSAEHDWRPSAEGSDS